MPRGHDARWAIEQLSRIIASGGSLHDDPQRSEDLIMIALRDMFPDLSPEEIYDIAMGSSDFDDLVKKLSRRSKRISRYFAAEFLTGRVSPSDSLAGGTGDFDSELGVLARWYPNEEQSDEVACIACDDDLPAGGYVVARIEEGHLIHYHVECHSEMFPNLNWSESPRLSAPRIVGGEIKFRFDTS